MKLKISETLIRSQEETLQSEREVGDTSGQRQMQLLMQLAEIKKQSVTQVLIG